MRKWIRLTKNEDGAELIEAVIIYPIVCLCIFFLLYIGLYILQSMTLSSYAQKIAVLAAREIARPGYISLVTNNDEAYANGAIEMQLGDYSNGIVADANKVTDSNGNQRALISIPTSAKEASTHAYRYWGLFSTKNHPAPLLCGTDDEFIEMIKSLVDTSSFLKSGGDVSVKLKTENRVIAQYVNISVTQPLVDFPALTALGVKTPTVSASARAAATDMDELVRNTDLAADAISVVTQKLGIDMGSIKKKVSGAVKKIEDLKDSITKKKQ